jgi:hypothetical protein
VIDDQGARWEPATDLTRLLLRAQLIAAVMLVLWLLRGRRDDR